MTVMTGCFLRIVPYVRGNAGSTDLMEPVAIAEQAPDLTLLQFVFTREKSQSLADQKAFVISSLQDVIFIVFSVRTMKSATAHLMPGIVI